MPRSSILRSSDCHRAAACRYAGPACSGSGRCRAGRSRRPCGRSCTRLLRSGAPDFRCPYCCPADRRGIVNDANENADRIRNEADAKAREVIRQALTEKQAELEEIDRLKASREEFKAEYLKLIQHFMDDAQNSFPSDLMASTPVGSAASPAVTVPAAEPLPVAEPVIPVADPFAPIDNFAADDLD